MTADVSPHFTPENSVADVVPAIVADATAKICELAGYVRPIWSPKTPVQPKDMKAAT